MDSKTLNAYTKLAGEYSSDWLSQPVPSDMYTLLEKFFIANGETADIGCGNGRDAGWLAAKGFKVSGYDSSAELLSLARKLNPNVRFASALLPCLSEITNQFDNVMCETVIMHLPNEQIPEAVKNLRRIVKNGGVLYLSWRVTEREDIRHEDGRLYSAFVPEFILDQFSKSSILHFEDVTSASSGKRVCRLICKIN
jgi:2-polyprenyl-3-methyl-5-hydroxy-6-metoxy-1,4-benzoquinol methylase